MQYAPMMSDVSSNSYMVLSVLRLLVFIPFFPLGCRGLEYYYSACKGGAWQTRQGFGGKD